MIASQATIEGAERLVFFVLTDAGSLTAAALQAALRRTESLAPPIAELEPATLSDSLLAAWRRPSTAEAARGNAENGPSDGRWLWLLALALLGLETWLRRSSREAVAATIRHDAAA